MKTRFKLTAGAVACLAIVACAGTPHRVETPETAQADWPQHIAAYQEAYFAANPAFAVMQGRHEFDGKLPDWSAAGVQREIDWLKDQRQRTEEFPAAALTPSQRFEQQYLLSRIDADLFWLDEAQQPFTSPEWYLNGGLDPSVYLARPYASADVRIKAFTAYLRAIPTACAQIRANLRTPMPRSFIDLGVRSFAGYASFYRGDAAKAYAEVADPALQADLKAAIEPAAKAMQDLADWLTSEIPRATQDFALGPQKFADMLRMTENVTTPLTELQAVADADLKRNLDELKKVCARFAPKKSLAHCVDKEEADKPQGSPVEAARAQLVELRQFIVDHDLVSIPGPELALVNQAPPYQASNFAYIDPAGPYDKGMPSVYYIAPPDPSWSKADQLAYIPGKAKLLFTSAHEVWPGHFLQFLHANRSPFQFGQIFVGYAFAEGWAHYGEETMWEAGLGKGDAETHVGQLTEALLRNVRFVCALGMHTQGMTMQACEQMFREKGFQDPGNARQQAERGTYDPAYLNYTLGKLMIRKLRADWTASRGGRKAWRDFHDQFLSYGGPPIPLVREQMLGTTEGSLF
jgi:hypothetical protein